MKNFVLGATAALFLSATASAQPDSGEFPPNAQPGKCYAKCYVADKYETYTETIEATPASNRLELVPATYEDVTERIVTREASKRLEVVPATFETVTERVVSREASKRLEMVPAVYEDTTETIEVAPASTRWVRGKADPNCVSANPDDCKVWCLENVPAQTRTVRRRVMKTPASTREIEIPAEYKTITRTVQKSPATVREVEIPAVYGTTTKRVVKTPASYREIAVPGTSQTVTKTRLVSKGGFNDWQEVVCAKDINVGRIRAIQEALQKAGYNPGALDGVFGADTRAALQKFQQDKGLPVGGLNKATMEALGLSMQ